MQRTPVQSSEIQSIGYDPDAQTLEIEFRSGKIYQYSGVPPVIYTDLMSAPSHGRYFNQVIKKGGFAYRLLAT